jgi:dihydrofolate reductase
MDAVVAVYENWGIGKDGTQPVVVSADRKHFRAVTGSGAVIYGRKTLLDFPGGKPLPGRCNAVLTRQADFSVPGAIVCHSPQAAILATQEYDDCFVIGGESVYRQMLPYCRRVFLTRICVSPDCDAFFPDLDASGEWEITERSDTLEENGISYAFFTYTRKGT